MTGLEQFGPASRVTTSHAAALSLAAGLNETQSTFPTTAAALQKLVKPPAS